MTRLGPVIVIKKLDELFLDDISTILEPLAKRSGVSRKILAKDIERAREAMFEENHGKACRSAVLEVAGILSTAKAARVEKRGQGYQETEFQTSGWYSKSMKLSQERRRQAFYDCVNSSVYVP